MKRICVTILMLISLACYGYGSSRPNLFFASEDLSSTMISTDCIAQDVEGYIWIGTEYGLNRYDGYRFVSYLNDAKDHHSLGYNLVSTLLCEPSGQIWVGTAKGLDLYESASNHFVHFRFPGGIKPRVSRILRLKDGQLIVGTAGYGFYRVNEQQKELTRISGYTAVEDDEFYSVLFEDSRGMLSWSQNKKELNLLQTS